MESKRILTILFALTMAMAIGLTGCSPKADTPAEDTTEAAVEISEDTEETEDTAKDSYFIPEAKMWQIPP